MFTEALIPLAAIVMVFGIPLAAILTFHQRKMAELIHGPNRGHSQQELDAMRGELAYLRDRLNQQALLIEDLNGKLMALPRPAEQASQIETRLNQ